VLVAGCDKGAKPAPVPAAPVTVEAGWTCDPLPFAATTPLPEASAAAWLSDGLMVVGDSGNDGAYVILDPETGETKQQGKLPLGDGADDDLEGLAARGDKFYGLTSSGYMRVWRRAYTGFELVDGPYPIGSGDTVCHGINCGRNYEGLCLVPLLYRGANPSMCAGFAASKTDGRLYCLTMLSEPHDIILIVGNEAWQRSVGVAPKRQLADCAFDERGRLWAGGNIYSGNMIWQVDGWGDPATARVIPVGSYGIGNAEVIAVRGDVVYRMSDTNTAPSLLAKFRCSRAAK
jgi:hypothetical protein